MLKYDDSNVFAKILKGELPCNKVYDDDFCLAFHDINPSSPVHVLVVSKGEYVSFNDFMDLCPHVESFFRSVRKIISHLNLENGYRIVTNCGKDGQQEIGHFHIHILGGSELGSFAS